MKVLSMNLHTAKCFGNQLMKSCKEGSGDTSTFDTSDFREYLLLEVDISVSSFVEIQACLTPDRSIDVVELNVDGREWQEASHDHLWQCLPVPRQGWDFPGILGSPGRSIELSLQWEQNQLRSMS